MLTGGYLNFKDPFRSKKMYLKVNHQKNSRRQHTFTHDCDNCIEPSKGILQGNKCSNCKQVAKAPETVKCNHCQKQFHSSCIVRPISSEVVETLKENYCLWWTCLSCITEESLLTHETSIANTATGFGKSKKEKSLQDITTEAVTKIKEQIRDLENNLLTKIPALVNGFNETSTDRNLAETDQTISKKRRRESPSCSGWTNDTTFVDYVHKSTLEAENDFPQKMLSSNKDNKKVDDVQVIILRKKDTQETNEGTDDQWHDFRKTISIKLSSIKTVFIKQCFHDKGIKIGFPNIECRNSGDAILQENNYFGLEAHSPRQMLPKLTIHNVPLDIDEDSELENTMDEDRREKLNTKLIKSILNKNEGVKQLVENGCMLKIIYMKKQKYSYTVAIKVSSEIRLHLLRKCFGKIYICSARCKVSDRCHLIQCYHCQEIGHMAKNCPDKLKNPVCMYCSESHLTRECTARQEKMNYKCANCEKANDPEISKNSKTHNAGSDNCPLRMAVVEWVKNNTETQPKNQEHLQSLSNLWY